MSYRELRNFTEHMRALGYQRLVSVERDQKNPQNFRTPNFELVASVLYWMVKRYDPEIRISDCIETEDDRVEFLTNVAEALATKARLKLNTKRLYAADGRAVKELLKIASLLFEADKAVREDKPAEKAPPMHTRLKDIRKARDLATSITDTGAKLYDLLRAEKDIKKNRAKALSFLDAVSANVDSTPEHKFVEKSVAELIAQTTEDIESTKKQCQELQADERALEAKIKKKQQELERHEKRLESLQTVRPAFMDEYERLERELEKQYAAYLERYRNLDYLQHELDMYEKAEEQQIVESNQALDKLRKKQLDDELKQLRGDYVDIETKEAVPSQGGGTFGSFKAEAKPSSSSNKVSRGGMGTIPADDESEDIDSDDRGPDGAESESVSIADRSGSDIDDLDDDDDDISAEDDDDDDHFDAHSDAGEF